MVMAREMMDFSSAVMDPIIISQKEVTKSAFSLQASLARAYSAPMSRALIWLGELAEMVMTSPWRDRTRGEYSRSGSMMITSQSPRAASWNISVFANTDLPEPEIPSTRLLPF